jgi:hypothetical protein
MEVKMENDKQLDSWDDFLSGNFLKAADVNNQEDAYVVVDVEVATRKEAGKEDKQNIRLSLERNEKESEFDLNKTNAKKLKDLGITSPKALIGKKVYFKKALVRNPKTNAEVESLRVWKIE